MFSSQKFRVVSWNIENSIKFDAVARVLSEKIPADIYALQEVDAYTYRNRYKNIAEDLANSLGMQYIFGAEFREFAQEGRGSKPAFHGQAFIAKSSPVRSKRLLLHHQARDWSRRRYHTLLFRLRLHRLKDKTIEKFGSRELGFAVAHFFQPREGGRVALIGEFQIGDRRVYLYNTHLESHCNEEERAFQMQDILEDVDLRVAQDDAVIILGDLNTALGASSPVIQAAEERGFRDALTHFADKDTATCTNGQRLDWILIKNLRATNVSVYGDGFAASDHLPVVAELEFV